MMNASNPHPATLAGAHKYKKKQKIIKKPKQTKQTKLKNDTDLTAYSTAHTCLPINCLPKQAASLLWKILHGKRHLLRPSPIEESSALLFKLLTCTYKVISS